MSLFGFTEEDARIFQYSKGARGEDGKFITVFADPVQLGRAIDLCLPNRNHLIDQHMAAENLKVAKAQAVMAYEQDPARYITMLVIRDHAYQPMLPDLEGKSGGIPNPESALDFAKRMNVPPPGEYTLEEVATIKMGAIGHQNLCRGIREAFDLLPFDQATGQGCTDLMAIAILNSYQEFLEKKNPSTPETQTSSPPSQAA